MPRSLLARLLAVSLTVAVCAIAATAWLTYRTTSDELQGEVDRVLETDASVYQELIAYAGQHPSWDDVAPLVGELSERTGRRIALTTPDGSLLADSARLRGDDDVELPSAAAALIDVLSFPADPGLPAAPTAPAPAGDVSPASEQELARNAALVERVTACLTAAEIPHAVVDVGGGLRTVTPTDPAHLVEHRACWDEAEQAERDRNSADPALLYLGSATGPFDPLSAAGRGKTVATILAVAGVTLGVTVAAGRRLLRPVHDLTRAARRMEAGDTSVRVDVTGRDEIASLAHAFNAMADAAERNERARQAMVDDVAHELRNPLANIRGHLEAAQDGLLAFDRALIDSLLEEAQILERLTGDLRDLALADAGRLRLHPEEVDVAQVARQVVSGAQARADAGGVSLSLDEGPAVVLRADPTRLRQAFANLVDNAVRYTAPGGAVRVAIGARATSVSLAVTDTGVGIAPDDLAHVFDRFYRADPSRSRRTGGSGLGLAIAKHLVEAHHGSLDVESEVGRGSTFTISLPVHTAELGAPAPAPAITSGSGRGGR